MFGACFAHSFFNFSHRLWQFLASALCVVSAHVSSPLLASALCGLQSHFHSGSQNGGPWRQRPKAMHQPRFANRPILQAVSNSLRFPRSPDPAPTFSVFVS